MFNLLNDDNRPAVAATTTTEMNQLDYVDLQHCLSIDGGPPANVCI